MPCLSDSCPRVPLGIRGRFGPQRVAGSMILLWCQVGLALPPGESSPQPTANAASLWQSLQGPGFSVRFHNQDRADAEKISRFLGEARERLCNRFAAHGPEALLAPVDMVVFIHPADNEYASAGTVTLKTSRNGDAVYAELHLLAPARIDPSSVTVAGERKDDAYFRKTLTHEYASLLIDRITRTKPTGWRFGNAPSWFIQGYPEYLGLTESSPHAKSVTQRLYEDLVLGQPDRVDLSFGINVTDPYVDGALLLAFMHEEFGSQKVEALLTSPDSTFGQAMRSVLNVSLESFAEKWRHWLKSLKARRKP